jgi:phage terminase large subunit-like protein
VRGWGNRDPAPRYCRPALERERAIRQAAEVDVQDVAVRVEQEPASGGKESVEARIRMLAGWNVAADRVTGNKEHRAQPYAAQVQAGNVSLLAGKWNGAFE